MSDKSEIEAIRTVKRYTQPCVQQQLGPEFKVAEVPLFESAKGKWVLFTDYDALLAERDALSAHDSQCIKDRVSFCEEIEELEAVVERRTAERDAARAELKEAVELIHTFIAQYNCDGNVTDAVDRSEPFLDRVGKQP